jgi:hypothetical protein
MERKLDVDVPLDTMVLGLSSPLISRHNNHIILQFLCSIFKIYNLIKMTILKLFIHFKDNSCIDHTYKIVGRSFNHNNPF